MYTETKTNHFVEPRRVLERVPDVNQVLPFLLLLGSDEGEAVHQVLDVGPEVFDGLQPVGEIPIKKTKRRLYSEHLDH